MQVAVLPPSSVVTVIVAVPSFTPVTNPLLSTVATAVLLLSHVTFLFVALEGVTVALSWVFSFSFIFVFPLILTPSTSVLVDFTVTVQLAVFP